MDDDFEKLIGWVLIRGMICAALFGLGLSIWGVLWLTRRINRSDDPRHQKPPPDAP
jgi:hypothetical protein